MLTLYSTQRFHTVSLTALYHKLKPLCSSPAEEVSIDGGTVVIRRYHFSSVADPPCDVPAEVQRFMLPARLDGKIAENRSFTFPVVFPQIGGSYSRAILMFHGINERSWKKYLPWAYTLAERTHRPVILFPMAFHVNRGLRRWVSPQAMQPLLEQRQALEGQEHSTFANVAISQRIHEAPMRFYIAGHQSAEDIVRLIALVGRGQIEGLREGARVDAFAYSIGAMLAQALFIANPGDLLSGAKMFMFCGGAHFSTMRGCTRLIMDCVAHTALRSFFLNDFLSLLDGASDFAEFFGANPLGQGLAAMIEPSRNAALFEQRMAAMAGHLQVVTLREDQVIPSRCIHDTFAGIAPRMGCDFMHELHFEHEYRHEMPFPIFNDSTSRLVDASFEQVFDAATEFFLR
ncbi:MAG: hypothetical protein IJU72_03725 [Bacteroidales bacterium]|nr:hypothetical protein [Bacteroidales bacterium]